MDTSRRANADAALRREAAQGRARIARRRWQEVEARAEELANRLTRTGSAQTDRGGDPEGSGAKARGSRRRSKDAAWWNTD